MSLFKISAEYGCCNVGNFRGWVCDDFSKFMGGGAPTSIILLGYADNLRGAILPF